MSEKPEVVATRSSVSDEQLNTLYTSFKKSQPESRACQSRPLSPQPGTSFEVFRNNTTAVEVIVKEIQNKSKTKLREPTQSSENHKIIKLQRQVQDLKIDLNNANTKAVLTRKGFGTLVSELQKQLDITSTRERDQYTKNIFLQIENEKLKAMLETKGRAVQKLRNEMMCMRRVIKFLSKSLKYSPAKTEANTFASDTDYDEFERDLKVDGHVRFASNTFFDGLGSTVDSTVSKNGNSFDKC